MEEKEWAHAAVPDLEEEWAHAAVLDLEEQEWAHSLADLEEQVSAEAVADLEDLESIVGTVADMEEEPADAVSVALEIRCNPISIEWYDEWHVLVCTRRHLQECQAVAPNILPPLHQPRHKHRQLESDCNGRLLQGDLYKQHHLPP